MAKKFYLTATRRTAPQRVVVTVDDGDAYILRAFYWYVALRNRVKPSHVRRSTGDHTYKGLRPRDSRPRLERPRQTRKRRRARLQAREPGAREEGRRVSDYTERAAFEERRIAQDERHCQHCRHADWDPDGNYCAHPAAIRESIFGRSCWSFRRSGEACGPNGLLFERKEAVGA